MQFRVMQPGPPVPVPTRVLRLVAPQLKTRRHPWTCSADPGVRMLFTLSPYSVSPMETFETPREMRLASVPMTRQCDHNWGHLNHTPTHSGCCSPRPKHHLPGTDAS